jgi:peptide subunit release factor 1 (eRF1)
MTAERDLGASLRALVELPGPFVSLYLDTQAATEEGPLELDLRWRGLRERAAEEGAPEEGLAALDSVVDGSHLRGDGLAAFTSGDTVAAHFSLPSRIEEAVRFGAAPGLVPLLEWHQDNPRLALVLADRVGAEIHVLGGSQPEFTHDVEGDTDPITKVRAGGASNPRFQRRAENNWEGNAKEVAAELGAIARRERFDFLVVAAEVRALAFLREKLDVESEVIAVELDARPDASLEELSDDIERVSAAFSAQTTEDVLARFREERGQRDRAAEGEEATLEALRKAQVGTLLVTRDVSARAWLSRSDLTQAATDRAVLEALGLDDLAEAELADVLVRAALGTGAALRVVPVLDEEHGPRAGVGALLRY